MNHLLQDIKDNVAKVMIGKGQVTELMLAALAAGGHVLLEDVPGTGKTVLARTLAKSMDLKFERIQFTPDLLPSDVTGLSFYHQKQEEFIFQAGPVFTNLLLADEINRATPRTQSSLLECMAERQVTVDGVTRILEEPFFVISTENPGETLGCYPLPEAQLYRILMKIPMGGLNEKEERQLLDRFITAEPLKELAPVCKKEQICAMQRACREVFVHGELWDYIVRLIHSTRKQGTDGASGVSPRGTLALLRAAQGYALVQGRDYVAPEDIKAVAKPVLAHRMIVPAESERQKLDMIDGLLSRVAVPTEDWTRKRRYESPPRAV